MTTTIFQDHRGRTIERTIDMAAAALREFRKGWFTKQSSLLYLLRQTYRDRATFDPIDRANSRNWAETGKRIVKIGK